MLLWLQENAEVNLGRIRDADRNGLLHQIAKKKTHVAQFFAATSQVEWKLRQHDLVIRWCQCRVLRCLVENSFVELKDFAFIDSAIVRSGKGLMFLGGQWIPEGMNVGVFLCFTAIEFNDLQSFQWLVEDQRFHCCQCDVTD